MSGFPPQADQEKNPKAETLTLNTETSLPAMPLKLDLAYGRSRYGGQDQVFFPLIERQSMKSCTSNFAEDKKCISCGAQGENVQLLNPRAESRGGVECYYFRCGQCRQYFVEYWINGELKTVHGS
jgi:hypothetical protein